jgi:hypothetical protein
LPFSLRFPEHFMFQLTTGEYENLKCQIGISRDWGGRRRSLPYAFTESDALFKFSAQTPACHGRAAR